MRLVSAAAALLVSLSLPAPAAEHPRTVVIVSAGTEWKVVKSLFPAARYLKQPYGEYFLHDSLTLVFQGGWGKISAAASAQYAISRWNPQALVNLGTCGGIAGRIGRDAVIAATRTVVYDIVEEMGDPAAAIRAYSTDLDLSWAGDPPPSPVIAAPILSADRDLSPAQIPALIARYDAIAVDWESASIAWTARRNNRRVLILRGVSDLVSPEGGGEAYGNRAVFEEGAARVMKSLFAALPRWLDRLYARPVQPSTRRP